MNIPPAVSMWLNIVYLLVVALATGTLTLTNIVSHDVAVQIVAWAGFAAGVINIVMHGQSSSEAGPGTPGLKTLLGKPMVVVFAILIGGAMFLGLGSGGAYAKAMRVPLPPHRPARTIGPQKLSLDINKLISQIQAASLQDLQAAEADADGNKDVVAKQCYAAIIVIVQSQQNALASQANLPPVHLFTNFQQARDFVVSMRAGSPVSTACAPLANEVKLDVLNFVAAVTAGTISLSSFGL